MYAPKPGQLTKFIFARNKGPVYLKYARAGQGGGGGHVVRTIFRTIKGIPGKPSAAE